MLLYIIRHGDPIYEPDSLTEKGHEQAKALAKRLAVNGLDKIYASPMIRAQQTAQPTCDLLGLDFTVEEWTSEDLAWNQLSVLSEDNNYRHWCFQQQNTNLRNNDTALLGDDWYKIFKTDDFDPRPGVKRIYDASDEFLARLGYCRKGHIYEITNPSEKKVAVFCHQGFGLTWMSHLLDIPPHMFWSSFDITHSSISIFEFENYENGITNPKCICLSDTSHIYKEELPLQFQNKFDI